MPIIVNDPQLNSAPKVQEAVFSPEELRDRDWMLEGTVNCEDGSCASLDTLDEVMIVVQQDIRHHLKETHATLQRLERPLEIIRAVLECPNTHEIPDILRNIFKFVSAIYDDGFKEQALQKQLKRIRRKPARRTTKSRKSRKSRRR